MAVVDFLKKKRELLAQNQFELKDWISPTIRDHWSDFVQQARNSQIAAWAREHQLLSNSGNEVKPLVLHPEAQSLLGELSGQIGEEVHVGEWFTVTQECINQFASATHDEQWIHTDPKRAEAESPFKAPIAHGFLTLSLLPKLTDSVDPENPRYPTAKMAVNFGLNQVRFPYPVKVGSRVRARSRLASVGAIKRGLELVNEITVEIEGCRRPGCVAESVLRLYF